MKKKDNFLDLLKFFCAKKKKLYFFDKVLRKISVARQPTILWKWNKKTRQLWAVTFFSAGITQIFLSVRTAKSDESKLKLWRMNVEVIIISNCLMCIPDTRWFQGSRVQQKKRWPRMTPIIQSAKSFVIHFLMEKKELQENFE